MNLNSDPTDVIDFDRIMQANLTGVFGEGDPEKRLATLQTLYTSDGTLIDPEGIAQGHVAICDQVSALHRMLPPGLVFTPVGTAVGHHGAGRLRWQVGLPEEAPFLTGTDVALFDGALIKALYVFVDPHG